MRIYTIYDQCNGHLIDITFCVSSSVPIASVWNLILVFFPHLWHRHIGYYWILLDVRLCISIRRKPVIRLWNSFCFLLKTNKVRYKKTNSRKLVLLTYRVEN